VRFKVLPIVFFLTVGSAVLGVDELNGGSYSYA